MSVRNLDLEYLPSKNVVRFSEYEQKDLKVLENYAKVLEEQTQSAKATYKTRLGVRYGGHNDNQLMDIYYKHEEADTPIFVFIHGGYWQLFTNSTSGSFVDPLVKIGYRVINVDYNLCPQVTLEEQMNQMKTFFVWLLNYSLQTNATKIMIAGHSAGAHLALTALDMEIMKMSGANKICTFFLISGVYDLRELYQLECVNPNNILGLDYQKAIDLSPLLWNIDTELIKIVNNHNIKIHHIAAEYDTIAFKLQMEQLFEKFKKAQWTNENLKMEIFKGYDHFDIIEKVPMEGSEINKYIVENCLAE